MMPFRHDSGYKKALALRLHLPGYTAMASKPNTSTTATTTCAIKSPSFTSGDFARERRPIYKRRASQLQIEKFTDTMEVCS